MILKGINLGLTFFLELCMLGALAYWGFQSSDNLLVRLALGIGSPLLAAAIWGSYMAPQSTRRLTGVSYLLLKFVLFGAAAVVLVAAGRMTLAIIFAVVAVINQILLLVWKQDTPPFGTG